MKDHLTSDSVVRTSVAGADALSGVAHTPGPWLVTGDAGHPANIRITSTARRHIAKVYALSAERDLECEANARLIAAAPDLLEAAQTVLADLGARIEAAGSGPVPLFRGIAALHAAIGKATGAAS